MIFISAPKILNQPSLEAVEEEEVDEDDEEARPAAAGLEDS